MRRLGQDDLGDILALRKEVLGGLEHPDIYVPEADETAFVKAHLGERGMSFGVFAGSRMISYGMLGLPAAADKDNLGAVIGLDAGQRARVAHLASCMTVREYRGHCIQRDLVVARMALARELGCRYCLAMVSLRNRVSRNNLFAAGMAVRWVGYLDDLRRQLMYLDMEAPDAFDETGEALVDPLDFERQCELAHAGSWGIAETEREGLPLLIFRKRRTVQGKSATAS